MFANASYLTFGTALSENRQGKLVQLINMFIYIFTIILASIVLFTLSENNARKLHNYKVFRALIAYRTIF